jgi:hypothetical protein
MFWSDFAYMAICAKCYVTQVVDQQVRESPIVTLLASNIK